MDNASRYDVTLQFRRFWRCRDFITSVRCCKIVSAILQVSAATNAFHSVFLQSTALYIETDLILEKVPARQEERCNRNARKASETAVRFSYIYKRNNSHFTSRITCFRQNICFSVSDRVTSIQITRLSRFSVIFGDLIRFLRLQIREARPLWN